MSTMPTREIRRGGLIGLLTGAALVVLALIFLTRPLEEPSQILGAFLPLAVGLLAVGLGALALGPLVTGNLPTAASRLALTLRVWAVVGLGLTVWGVARGELPWTLGALAPLIVVGLLFKDAGRLADRAAHGFGTSDAD